MLQYLLDKVSKIHNKIVEIQKRRVAYWQLQNLSDKELRDLNISRHDIQRAVYGKFN
jgi:uncharacterized protein YjiS (DUF1127 family)